VKASTLGFGAAAIKAADSLSLPPSCFLVGTVIAILVRSLDDVILLLLKRKNNERCCSASYDLQVLRASVPSCKLLDARFQRCTASSQIIR